MRAMLLILLAITIAVAAVSCATQVGTVKQTAGRDNVNERKTDVLPVASTQSAVTSQPIVVATSQPATAVIPVQSNPDHQSGLLNLAGGDRQVTYAADIWLNRVTFVLVLWLSHRREVLRIRGQTKPP